MARVDFYIRNLLVKGIGKFLTKIQMPADNIGQSELNTEIVDVTVLAGQTSGTATVTAGSIILGYYPTGNQDQFVDNIAISTTTLTLTLAAAATINNTYKVVLLKP